VDILMGDGHIYVKNNIFQFGIMSSKLFCEGLKLHFEKKVLYFIGIHLVQKLLE